MTSIAKQKDDVINDIMAWTNPDIAEATNLRKGLERMNLNSLKAIHKALPPKLNASEDVVELSRRSMARFG